jgi:PhzF family phenazine biosynthesis protein
MCSGRRAFQGNGLVVVLDAEGLSPEMMQAVTREVCQFETVFLTGVDLDRRSAVLRILTEGEEVDFAGHPVLGAAAVLQGMLPGESGDEWALGVAHRTIEVRTSPGAYWGRCPDGSRRPAVRADRRR